MSTIPDDPADFLVELAAEWRQPSVSAALGVEGRLRWSDAVGDADPLDPGRPPKVTTRYRIGSITKPQVAVAVLTLVEAAEVDLDRPVATWIPEAPGGEATVRQFLSHTAGLPAEPPGPWWERAGSVAWDQLVASPIPRLFAPGTRFHYSNLGYAILGRLVEVVHAAPWDAVLDTVVWGPLGMADTGRTGGTDHATGVAVHPRDDLLHPEPVAAYHAMGPAGELWSTPSDLVRFGCFLAGLGDGLGVLRPETLAAMRTPQAWEDVAGTPWGWAYGLGVMVGNDGGRRRHGHAGSVPGFTARLSIDPESTAVLAVCGNATGRFGDTDPLLAAAEALPGRVADAAGHSVAVTSDLVGTWYWGPLEHRVEHAGELLMLRRDGIEGAPSRFADDSGSWIGVGGDYFHGEELRAVRDADGRVRQLDVGTFCFTRTPYDPQADLPGGAGPEGWQPWAHTPPGHPD